MPERKSLLAIVLVSGVIAALGQSDNAGVNIGMPASVSRALTAASEYDDETPSYSPDGNFVVFSRRPVHPPGKSRLWIISVSGGPARPLTPVDFPLHCTRPAWSPDGNLIAFRAARMDENAGGIWVIGADGHGLRRLTDEEKFDDLYPVWAPDGSWIAFSRGLITQEPSNDLWQMRLDGWQRQLTRGDKYEGKATVSPDGKTVAFATDRPDRQYPDTNIWIMSIVEGEASARPFTVDGGSAPSWSPNGRWIAFSSKLVGGVYVKPAEDGRTIRVWESTGMKDDAHPAWSPDGNSIVFESADSPDRHHLEVISVRDLLKPAK